jgi:hypothetical protein
VTTSRSLARVLAVLIACAGAAALIVDAYWYSKLRSGTFVLHLPEPTDRPVQPYWTGTTTIGLFPLLGAFTIAAEVVWLFWQHRATANLWSRGYVDLKIRPGWAVGWWFIPIASLFMPFVAMLELDRRSTPDGRPRSASPLIGGWWASYLAMSFIPIVGALVALIPTFRDLAERADGTLSSIDFSAAAHTAAPWVLAAGALQLVTAALAIAVVLRIDAAQRSMMTTSGWLLPVPARPDVRG